MEFRVGANEVLLSLHPTYSSEDNAVVLQQVSKYKPLTDYLTKFRPPTGFTLSRMTVRNILTIAQRVQSVTLDVAVTCEGRDSLVQTITLTDENSAIVLVALSVDDRTFAVLTQQPRIAMGGEVAIEALTGTFGKDGSFEGPAAALLDAAQLGFSEKECVALSQEEVSLGKDGVAPMRLLKFAKVMTAAEYDSTLKRAKAVQTVDGGSSTGLFFCPLEQIAEVTTDVKAILAGSLAAQKN